MLIFDCNRTESFSNEIRFIYCSRKINFKLLNSMNYSLKDKSININYNSKDIKTMHQKSFFYIVYGSFFSIVFFSLLSYIIGKRLNQKKLSFEANKLLFRPEDFLDINIFIKKSESFKKDSIKAEKIKVKNHQKIGIKI